MEARVAGGAADAVGAATVAQALRLTAAKHGDVVAYRTVDDSAVVTWGEALRRVDAIAAGLASLGVRRGESVALMLANGIDFPLVDHAISQLGGVPFSVYVQYPADQVAYVCGDAEAKVIVTEQQFLDVVLKAREQLPLLEHVIVVDGEAPAGVLTLAEVAERDSGFDVAAAAAELTGEDLLTLIYTSGTTGPPKGVQITHNNVMAGADAVRDILDLGPGSRVISWLPAAHIAERMAHHYIPTVFACTVTVCPDSKQIVSYLPQVKPAWFFAVPRVWEKLKAGLEAMQAGMEPEQREKVQAAMTASVQRVRLQQQGLPVPAELEAAWAEADAAMFSGLRSMLGLDEAEAVSVGAAPTSVDVLEFFHALGIKIAELWGMSETCGAGLTNRRDNTRIGTVGLPIRGAEVRLGDDGELLIRGEFVMAGYRGNAEKTAEALDADGWLHSGDIAEIDDDGFVRIVDRKKELIINAAGKNMSPANIEAQLKAGSPLIGQACVIGDARPYNTALIVLDPDFGKAWAAQNGLGDKSYEALCVDASVRAAIAAGVDAANSQLARVEQIKYFTVVEGDWLPGGDELTPTMKLKRKPISAKYAAEIEAMYSG
jgi:long-chain acyl-CoA synthetase